MSTPTPSFKLHEESIGIMLPPSVLEGARNCVKNYGKIQQDDMVVILDEPELRTDQDVIDALVAACTEVGANVDYLATRHLRDSWWEDVPEPVISAYQSADVVIHNHQTIGKPNEPIYNAMYEHGTKKVRNFAVTTEIMSSEWAQYPAELYAAIDKKLLNLVQNSDEYRFYSDTGTEIVGELSGLIDDERYEDEIPGRIDREQKYALFPPGVQAPARSVDAEGTIMVQHLIPKEAEMWGLPKTKFDPVELTVENNEVVDFQGEYAEQLEKGFDTLVEEGGVPEDEVYNIDSWHTGIGNLAHSDVHPHSDPSYAHKLLHHHPAMSHFHIGGDTNKDYGTPYFTHISTHDLNATIEMDDTTILEDGKLILLEDEEIQEIASKYGDPDRLLATEPVTTI